MTAKNPTTITVVTPDEKRDVWGVKTWWRDGPDLVVETNTETTLTFPLGEIVDMERT